MSMHLVRGALLALVLCLGITVAPAGATAPLDAPAAGAAQRQGGGDDWQVLRAWKKGVVRACRTTWDGDSFSIKVQVWNKARRGTRGTVLGARFEDSPWNTEEFGPVAAGRRRTVFEGEVMTRPRTYDFRARVTKGDQRSRWGKAVNLGQLETC